MAQNRWQGKLESVFIFIYCVLCLIVIVYLGKELCKENPQIVQFIVQFWPRLIAMVGLIVALTVSIFFRKSIKKILQKGWNAMGKIGKSNTGFGLLMLVFFISFCFVILPKIPKFNTWALVKIALAMGSFSILLIILIAITAITLSSKNKDKEKSSESLIRNIPSNHVWILRYAWHSDPGDETHEPKGYIAKKEGWSFYLPHLVHIDMGLVDLAPKARDPEELTKINTSDNQTAEVDWQIETIIFDPIRFIVRARNEEGRVQFENQKIKAILAHLCSNKKQSDLTHFEKGELQLMGADVLNEFNQAMLSFGIRAISLDIKKIVMPEEIRAAAEYTTVSKQRLVAAESKGEELQKIISATGASPTVTVAADIIRGGLNDLVELIGSFKKRNNKKED